MEEKPETKARFTEKNCQENKKRREIEQNRRPFAQARQGRAQPDSGEPGPAEAAPLITANRAKDRARDERGKDRVRRDHAAGKKCARGTKINQAGREPA